MVVHKQELSCIAPMGVRRPEVNCRVEYVQGCPCNGRVESMSYRTCTDQRITATAAIGRGL